MNDAVPAAALPFLDLLRRYHTDVTPHSGRHLIDHLLGVYRLLESWGNAPAICRAGLFHSIYGTNIFTVKSASFSERATIRETIGEEAERLAFLFCVSERPVAFLKAAAGSLTLEDIVHHETIMVTGDEIRALLEIEAANFLEEPENPDDVRLVYDTIRAVGRATPLLSAAAMKALAAYVEGQRAGLAS